MPSSLQFGVAYIGIAHTDADNFDIETRFRMASEAGVFDYIERSPMPGEVDRYLSASQRYGIPIRAGSFYYRLGRDERLIEWHLQLCRFVGSSVQNVQIFTHHVDGHPLTNDEVATCYLRVAEVGESLGISPCFEIHVNMWSEHFGRVLEVAHLVERCGVKFNITLDASHVVFKVDHPDEQAVQGMRADIDARKLELDPRLPGNICELWIARNLVRHAHARSAVPRNPINVLARHPDGRFGRGIQYPFVRPGPNEWHSEWRAELLEPWKLVMETLMIHHARDAGSRLACITTEFIPFTDYGAGAGYSSFDNNVACARWLRSVWERENDLAAMNRAATRSHQEWNAS